MTKQCCTCHEAKGLDAFCKDRKRADGLYPRCKECSKAYFARPSVRQNMEAYRRKHYAENRDSILSQVQAYAAENLERIREYQRQHHAKPSVKAHKKAWRIAHADEIRARQRTPKAKAYCREYSRTHRENIAAYDKEWSKRNAGRKNASSTRRRVRRIAATVAGDLAAIQAVYVLCASDTPLACCYCGNPALPGEREVDHRIPLSRGGKHSADNLCIACRWCNRSKGVKTADEYMHEQQVRVA